jgi:hypothetical protein
MDSSVDYFSSSVRHNFNNAIRRAWALRKTIGDFEMRSQAEYERTNVQLEHYQCRLSEYFARVFGRRFPCCHLLSAGVAKPVMSDPRVFIMSECPSGFRVELDKAERPGAEPSLERRGSLMMMAAHSIKHLSWTGAKLEEITLWVEENFPQPGSMTSFIENVPVEVLTLVSNGIVLYSNARVGMHNLACGWKGDEIPSRNAHLAK